MCISTSSTTGTNQLPQHTIIQHRHVLPPYAAATLSYYYTASACPSPIRACHSLILLHSTGLSFPHTRLPLIHITTQHRPVLPPYAPATHSYYYITAVMYPQTRPETPLLTSTTGVI